MNVMEPLSTDEKLESPRPPERDMDTQMVFGCTGFVVASFGTYFLSVWPFFLWLDIHNIPTLLKACASGLLPALLCGAYQAWKYGIAGAAGFIGGMMAVAIFLYLRFQQIFLEVQAQRIPPPMYPQWIEWFAPLMLMLLAILTATWMAYASSLHEERQKKR
ncbi:MAG: hypothetical protein H7Y17_17665 [Chlorobia bacterium]|nr:hypothetical protein [Fimbriimonadaceae bacterium]